MKRRFFCFGSLATLLPLEILKKNEFVIYGKKKEEATKKPEVEWISVDDRLPARDLLSGNTRSTRLVEVKYECRKFRYARLYYNSTDGNPVFWGALEHGKIKYVEMCSVIYWREVFEFRGTSRVKS